MQYEQLFWLHIKKSAGMTTRQLMQPHYTIVKKTKMPENFIQATSDKYNDILNNYRVVLGEYQFKRCLFAKKFLYHDRWEKLYSFAFSREPVDRCISMFYYLYWNDRTFSSKLIRLLNSLINERKLLYSTSYAFDVFLDYADQARHSGSIYEPIDSHFTTHTAPMYDDITDFEGNVLLTRVFRIEALITGLNSAFEACGIDKRIEDSRESRNINKDRKNFKPDKKQRARIEKIYAKDFDIYESAHR